ncbi:molecular chaperone TorD family protein [uncultured Georgenia sp.]|uniref:TorD/DmsD family molecular chaperone n=1 Tax=uncultured Georgenia sp. TaxID=378209 RepID=UPI00261C9230|nr:molecular chaperone TorD family protein [uncultured Georgenia sp.]HLV03477.1 molecular chaperone TorD family protein [Actinomycetaceae bacterium]
MARETHVLDPTRLDALATAFSVLGRFHREPPDAATLASFWELLDEWPLPDTPAAQEGLAALRAARDTGEDAETVRADHAALYGTLAVARVAPYESVHRGEEGLVFAEHTLQVRDAYRTLSLEAPRLNREPDDHIGLELEFVARSCLRALGALDQGSPRDAERYVRLGADFLRDHLLRWAPAMLDRVTQEARTRFMPGLARLTTGAIEEYARFTGVPTEA